MYVYIVLESHMASYLLIWVVWGGQVGMVRRDFIEMVSLRLCPCLA
jgi:hypothetical protein